jgi:hypothetical protein
MNSKFEVFVTGMIVGLVLLELILILTRLTPTHQQQKDRQDAIVHGAAHWVVDTNGVPSFEWNKK